MQIMHITLIKYLRYKLVYMLPVFIISFEYFQILLRMFLYGSKFKLHFSEKWINIFSIVYSKSAYICILSKYTCFTYWHLFSKINQNLSFNKLFLKEDFCPSNFLFYRQLFDEFFKKKKHFRKIHKSLLFWVYFIVNP